MRATWVVKQPFGNLFKFLITLFIVLVVTLAAATIWVNWALAAPSGKGEKKTFVIKENEPVSSFSQRLEEEKIIRNAFAFRIYLKLSGLDRKIQAGSFNLPGDKLAAEVALVLTTGRLDQWVTFIEGLRKEEAAEILAKKFNIDKEKFLTRAPEGYLFPDTYLIPINSDEDQILSVFKANFEKKFTKKMQNAAAEANLSPNQVIIIASIVERESRGKGKDERPIIAGILIKRWQSGWRLAADATVQYALGYSSEEKTWWRKNLTDQDLKVDNPYNTRKNIGLPPGPICSPGLPAIQAVISPKETAYLYYIHDKEGNPYYAETFEIHQQNIAKYLK